MLTTIKAVFFDVDGVLLDTLPAHLDVCRHLASQRNLSNINVLSPNQFKSDVVRAGIEISPMRSFFKEVGFRGDDLDWAVNWYDTNFANQYELNPFDGVKTMLERLSANYPMGIVTSNIINNIEKPLGEAFSLFKSSCIFDNEYSSSKAAALKDGAKNIGIKPSEILFVGDQRTDMTAAHQAGTQFLGVTYGWCFEAGDVGLDLVEYPCDIHNYVTHQS